MSVVDFFKSPFHRPLGNQPHSLIATPQDHLRFRPRGNWPSDNAIDLGVKKGTPIHAVADGTIGKQFGALNSKDPKLLGLRLHLLTPDNQFYYAHLSKIATGIAQGCSGQARPADRLFWGGQWGASPPFRYEEWRSNGHPSRAEPIETDAAVFAANPWRPHGQRHRGQTAKPRRLCLPPSPGDDARIPRNSQFVV